jgi:hypothetical protein
VAFGALWSYASRNRRLLADSLSPEEVRRLTRRFVAGTPVYMLSILVALVSAPACLALNALLALYYALPGGGAIAHRAV